MTVSINDDIVAIGSVGDDDNGTNSGSAYLFSKNEGGTNNWGQIKKLTSDDASTNGDFGNNIYAYDNFVIVGARGDQTDRGAAYVFARDAGGADNWGQIKKLTAFDGDDQDRFGTSLSADNDLLAVTASWDNDRAGAAYLFSKDEGGVDNWGFITKVTADDGDDSDFFGSSVSLFNDELLVGSIRDDDGGTEAGSVYAYSKNSGGADMWGQIQKLTAGFLARQKFLGNSVHTDGDLAIVGEPGDVLFGSEIVGSAFIYAKNADGNWRPIKELKASDGALGDHFGISVAIEGDIAIVGASEIDNRGAVYVFSKDAGGPNNWGEIRKVQDVNLQLGVEFGFSISLDEDIAVVGAPQEGDGAVYIYYRNEGGTNNWGEVQKLLAEDASGFEEFILNQFGLSVSINEDLIAVGSPPDAYIYAKNQGGNNNWGEIANLSEATSSDDYAFSVSISGDHAIVGDPNRNSGEAYIYSKDEGGIDNWGQVKKLTASDGEDEDFFGSSVSINNSVALVGASFDASGLLLNVGSAYLFSQNEGGSNNWGEAQKLVARQISAFDEFGTSVSLSGGVAVIGAPNDDVAGFNSGGAFIFENGGCPEDFVFFSNGGLTGEESGMTTYAAEGALESIQELLSTSIIDYKSNTSVTLFPNFSIINGAVFQAFIDGCD